MTLLLALARRRRFKRRLTESSAGGNATGRVLIPIRRAWMISRCTRNSSCCSPIGTMMERWTKIVLPRILWIPCRGGSATERVWTQRTLRARIWSDSRKSKSACETGGRKHSKSPTRPAERILTIHSSGGHETRRRSRTKWTLMIRNSTIDWLKFLQAGAACKCRRTCLGVTLPKM